MNPVELDFQPQIRELIRDFVGRDWLLREVARFVTAGEPACLLVTGEPGIGKSALAARLVREQTIHAHHFCQSRDAATLDPVAFAGSLCRQLCRSLPDFGRHLIEQEPVRLDVDVKVGAMSGGAVYGVYIDQLLVQTRSAEEAFEMLVRAPLESWARETPGRPVVLLVDALDEAIRLDRRPNILDLIATARGLPKGVRWLLTSRPGDHLDLLEATRLAIAGESPESIADVRAYVDALIADPALRRALPGPSAEVAALADVLVRRSAGNFLYLKVLRDWLLAEAAAGRPAVVPAHLPRGLAGVYRWFLDRLLARGSLAPLRRTLRPVLGLLAVAREALTFEQLSRLSGLSHEEVSDALSDAAQLLEPDPERDRSAIYHASFAEFLTDRRANPVLWVDPVIYHRRIADAYQHHRHDWNGCDDYGLRHLASHLAAADRRPELVRLLIETPAWIEVKVRRIGRRSLREDFALAGSGLADPLAPETALELLDLHAARHVAEERSGLYTDAVLETLTLLGRGEEAQTEARGRSSPKDRFDGLLTVHRALAERKGDPSARLEELVSTAAEIADPERRLAAFQRLFGEPCRADPAATLAAVRRIEDAAQRVSALVAAAGALAGLDGAAAAEALDAALSSAAEIASAERRAGALVEVSERLVAGGDARAEPTLRTAWAATSEVAAGRRRDGLLAEISRVSRDAGCLDLASAAARALGGEVPQTQALREAASALCAAGRHDEAVNAALAVGDVVARAETLRDVSISLTEAARFARAIEVACLIDPAALAQEGERRADEHWHPNAYFEPPPEWGRGEALDAVVDALLDAGRLREAAQAIEAYGDDSPWRRERAEAEVAEARRAPRRGRGARKAPVPAGPPAEEKPAAPAAAAERRPASAPPEPKVDDAALAAARAVGDAAERGRLLLEMARALARSGDRRAEAVFAEGLRASQESRGADDSAPALRALAQTLAAQGWLVQARRVAARITSQALRDPILREIRRGMVAQDLLAEALDLTAGLERPTLLLWELHPLLKRWIDCGRLDEAVALASRCGNEPLREAVLSVLVEGLIGADRLAEAREVASRLTTAAKRCEADLRITRRTLAGLRVDEALAATRALASPAVKAPLLVELAAKVDDGLLAEALEAARTIADAKTRAETLLELAQAMEKADDEHLDEAYEEARAAGGQIADARTRAKFLGELALVMKQSDRWEADEVLEEAREAVGGRRRTSQGIEAEIDFLIGLAENLQAEDSGEGRELFDQALDLAASSYDEWDDSEDLRRSIEKVLAAAGDPGELIDSLIDAARKVADDYERTEALIAIAQAVARTGQEELAENPLLEIEDEMEQDFARDEVERTYVEMRTDMGHYEPAWKLADGIASDEPREKALRYLAEHLGERGAPEESLQVAERFAPGELREIACSRVAGALARAGRIDEALAMARRIAARKPHDAALCAVAEKLAATGQLARALPLLNVTGVEPFVEAIAGWSGAFEKLRPGLSLEALRRVCRIAGWVRAEWREIHDLLS